MSELKPFRFAFMVADATRRTGEDWAAIAAEAEAFGFDTFAVTDHVGTTHSPLQVLGWIASCNSQLRLGTQVIDNDFRHPVFLAQETATLDLLSNGRVELGIGAGWKPSDYELSGIPFERGRIRVERLEESVRIIKALWSEGPVSAVGSHYQVNDLDGLPKPVQRPHPPIMIGGTRPRILSFAAREADIVSFLADPNDPATWTIDRLVAASLRVRDEAGERAIELQMNIDLVAVGDDRQVDRLAREAGFDPAGLDRSAYALAGPVQAVVEQLEHLREVAGISYFTIWSVYAEALAPVITELKGR
jgi:probable F420-dependent oxidoreductase